MSETIHSENRTLPARAGRQRIVVGISGATGIVLGVRLLETLRTLGVETHLVVSQPAHATRAYETDLGRKELEALADHSYAPGDFGAAVSSGSFRTSGMIIAPCSVRSLAEIATGVTTGLLTRAADVVLKERRRLVLMVRETPLHLGHIRNMAAVTEMGAIIMPPVPAFYQRPASIDEMVDHLVARALDLFGFDMPGFTRWGEECDDEQN